MSENPFILLDLVINYSLVARARRSAEEKTDGGSPLFGRSYERYLQFREESVIVAEHPAGKISALINRVYAEKKEWPHW